MAHKEFRNQMRADHERKLRSLGGHVDKKADERLIASAVHQHEDHEHGGKHTKLKFAAGGGVCDMEEKPAAKRLDRARGGATNAGGGKKSGKQHGAHVNVIVAPQVHPGMSPGMGAPPPPGMAPPPAPPPHPPMAPPPAMPAGGPPMAGGPAGAAMMPRPPMPMPGGMPIRARGGKVSYPIDDGAAGGEGRLEKISAYGKNADKGEGRKRGGKV